MACKKLQCRNIFLCYMKFSLRISCDQQQMLFTLEYENLIESQSTSSLKHRFKSVPLNEFWFGLPLAVKEAFWCCFLLFEHIIVKSDFPFTFTPKINTEVDQMAPQTFGFNYLTYNGITNRPLIRLQFIRATIQFTVMPILD